jgi:hypothetical protein
MEKKYPRDGKIHNIKKGKGEYDCILGISGGADSSYLLLNLVDNGYKVLVVTFDDTWNTVEGSNNIKAIVDKTGVDLETYVMDPDCIDDIYRSFLMAGLRDTDAPTDIGILGSLYRSAKKNNVNVIVDAHDFRSEGTTPLGWLYFDGEYVRDVHRKFGTFEDAMKDFPNVDYNDMLRMMFKYKIERPRPLYNSLLSRHERIAVLKKRLNWIDYGEHHGENKWTVFSNYIWMPYVFGLNLRKVFWSAQIRSGIRMKSVAERTVHSVVGIYEKVRGLEEEIADRLCLDLVDVYDRPTRTYRDFSTYKEKFERNKDLFAKMVVEGRVPESFYFKYCC